MKTLRTNIKHPIRLIIAFVALVTITAACSSNSEEQQKGGETAQQEQQAVQTGFNRLSDTQPIPVFDWSQERQTIIDVETIRATGATTTSAFYLEGIGLIDWCPSFGAPVPSTYQLSGSTQYVDLPGDESRQLYPIDQGEPTGAYIGGSSGTWTLCLDDNGNKFAHYWEGYVANDVGIRTNYPPELRIVLDDSTFTFTEQPE